MATAQVLPQSSMSDEEVVARVLSGDTAMFEIIMRRYNQRLYRAARSILRDDSEAEDVMQDAYVRAFEHLNQFAGRAKFSTWLTRIAVNEALARQHRRTRYQEWPAMSEQDESPIEKLAASTQTPEQQVSNTELRGLLEDAIQMLPERYRAVFVLREVEEMNTAETAYALDITEEAAKVRLHRARALLRRTLFETAGTKTAGVFAFNATRCDRVVSNVFASIYRSRSAG